MEYLVNSGESEAMQLVGYVHTALDPNANALARSQANRIIFDFKSKASPEQLCKVGFELVSGRRSAEVIMAGLQFIEHTVIYSWNEFDETNRNQIKVKLIELLRDTESPNLMLPYVQEALARTIVEIAKKEWPQLWINLIPELCAAAQNATGPCLILRRLVEDIGLLQLVDDVKRRQELSQSLNVVAPEVISTLFKLITEFKRLLATESQPHSSVLLRIKNALNTLLPYIEWVNPALFTIEDRISILFSLLSLEDLKMHVVACLIQLVERKAFQKAEKFDIARLTLTSDNMNLLRNSINTCLTDETEKHTDYLQKTGTILATLATNLPPNEKLYVEEFCATLHCLASRTELTAVASAGFAYNSFLRNIDKSILSEAELDCSSSKVLSLLYTRICQSHNQYCNESMRNLRSQFSQIVRASGRLMRALYCELVSRDLSGCLTTHQNEPGTWETMTYVIDIVASNVSRDDAFTISRGISDLVSAHQRFLVETNLELKSTILSIVSALFGFLSLAKERGDFGDDHLKLLHSILDSMFNCFKFDFDAHPGARGLRHHVTSLFIKLVSKCPSVLVGMFDFIHQSFETLAFRTVPSMTFLERQGVLETLLILSNEWNDPAKQSQLIEFAFGLQNWNKICTVFSTPENLAHFLMDANFLKDKGEVTSGLNAVYAVLRRIKAKKLEGSTAATPSSHPGYTHVISKLAMICEWVKCTHALVKSPQLEFVFRMSDADKSQVLGLSNHGVWSDFSKPLPVTTGLSVLDPVTNQELPGVNDRQKVQAFVQSVTDLSYGILGESCTIFCPNIYLEQQSLVLYMVESFAYEMDKMSDFRVRTVLRNAYRPFLLSAPISLTGMFTPFFGALATFVTKRLIDRWTEVQSANESPDDEGEEEKEVIESSVLRLLSKEYLELVQRLLERSATNDLMYTNGDQMDMDMDGNCDDAESSSRQSQKNVVHGSANELGEVGVILLEDQICFKAIIEAAVHGMVWKDSLVSFRACRCVLLAWKYIVKEGSAVAHIFRHALTLLCVYNDNEANLDILVRMVDLIILTFHGTQTGIAGVLVEWGASQEDADSLIKLYEVTVKEKKRKDQIRRLVRNNPNLEKNKYKKSSWLTALPKLHINKYLKPVEEVKLSDCALLIH